MLRADKTAATGCRRKQNIAAWESLVLSGILGPASSSQKITTGIL